MDLLNFNLKPKLFLHLKVDRNNSESQHREVKDFNQIKIILHEDVQNDQLISR